jgi:DivIVA domain-containing protein
MDEARQASAPFERVGRREYGYNTRQVDEFLAKARSYYNAESPSAKAITSRSVRSMAFDPAKAGYEPQAVDAALDRCLHSVNGIS